MQGFHSFIEHPVFESFLLCFKLICNAHQTILGILKNSKIYKSDSENQKQYKVETVHETKINCGYLTNCCIILLFSV